jgi:hypothetical protein
MMVVVMMGAMMTMTDPRSAAVAKAVEDKVTM